MGKIRLTDRPKFAYRNEESDSEEYILYHRCSLMVEKYIKMHVHNIEDVYNLRQEVLLKVLEGLDKSYYEQGHFFQWVMTIAVNMVNDYYRRKKNAPVLVALEDNVAQVFVSEKTFYRREKQLLKCERIYIEIMNILQSFTPFERELIEDLFFHNLSFRKAAERRNISKSTCFKLCKKLLEKLQRLLRERGIDITFLKDDE